MSTYGTRDATQFSLPTVEKGAKFYTLVDSTTNEITLKKIDSGNILGRTDLDITVGTVPTSGANAGKFIQNPNLGLTADQKAALQNPQTLKTVKDKGTETVSKAIQKSGKTPEEAAAEANRLLSPNKANSPDGTGDATTAQTKAEDLKTASGTATGRKKFPNLQYPLDLTTDKQDVIKFVMLKYKPSTFAKETLGFQRPDVNKDREELGRVFLPIPAGISDTTNCIWGGDEMTAGQIAGANIALGGITGGGAGFTTKIEEVIGAAIGKDKGVDVKTLVATQIAGSAAGAGSGLLKRVTGGALNPNLELLFDKPGLRTFGFTFKMSARSEREAKEIIGILRFFKQGMAPQKSTTNLFVKAPHTFRIEYLHKGKKHNFLNEFKECALTNLTTNYTPEGQYATFYDGPMVSYEMQMQFQELDPVFNEDYTNGTGSSGPDTNIGF